MFSEYFNPVKTEIIDYVNKLDNNQLGSKLKINGRDNLNSFEALDVVIFQLMNTDSIQAFKNHLMPIKILEKNFTLYIMVNGI